jgi:hypothetical protein
VNPLDAERWQFRVKSSTSDPTGGFSSVDRLRLYTRSRAILRSSATVVLPGIDFESVGTEWRCGWSTARLAVIQRICTLLAFLVKVAAVRVLVLKLLMVLLVLKLLKLLEAMLSGDLVEDIPGCGGQHK